MSERLFDPAHVDTAIQFTLGQRLMDQKAQEYLYVKAEEAINKGSVVRVDEAHSAHLMSTAAVIGNRVGVAAATLAKDNFGWVSIYGVGNLNVKANTGADRTLYSNATSGTLSATAANDRVDGIVVTTAKGAGDGLAAGMWQYPQVVLR